MTEEQTPPVVIPKFDIVANITESKLSLIRKYIFELLLLTLFFILYKMNEAHSKIEADMKTYMLNDRDQMIKVVMENTRVMRYYTPPPVDARPITDSLK